MQDAAFRRYGLFAAIGGDAASQHRPAGGAIKDGPDQPLTGPTSAAMQRVIPDFRCDRKMVDVTPKE